jgi:sodium-dependent dicarboxylate transporter 2/3/5
MFAIAIVHQGLDIRLAKIIIAIFGKSKRLFLAGLMVVSAILSSFLGEHTIIAIMLPIGLAIIKNVDSSKPDGKNAILLVLFSIAYGTIIGSIGTPSGGARNVIMINYLQEFTDTERIDYWGWIQYAYPILIIQLVVAYFVLQFAFPTSLDNVQVQGYKRSIAKSNSATNIRHLFSCLIIGLIITSWFLFNQELGLGIIALCGVLIFMICGMVPWEVINKNTNWGVILLFAATISLGFQINETGAASWLVEKFNELTSSFPEDSSFSWSFMAILTGLTSNFFTSSATTSLLGPMAIELQPNDISFGMSAAIASGFSFLTVVSSPTAMILYSTGLVSIKIFFRVGVLMFSSSILILYLVSKFYWVTL